MPLSHSGGLADAMSAAVSEIAKAAMPVPIATAMRPTVLVLDIVATLKNMRSVTTTGVGEGSELSFTPCARHTPPPTRGGTDGTRLSPSGVRSGSSPTSGVAAGAAGNTDI